MERLVYADAGTVIFIGQNEAEGHGRMFVPSVVVTGRTSAFCLATVPRFILSTIPVSSCSLPVALTYVSFCANRRLIR